MLRLQFHLKKGYIFPGFGRSDALTSHCSATPDLKDLQRAYVKAELDININRYSPLVGTSAPSSCNLRYLAKSDCCLGVNSPDTEVKLAGIEFSIGK